MLKSLILIFIISLNYSNAIADDSFNNALKSIQSQIKKSGSIDYKANCGQCQQSEAQTTSVYSSLNKKSVELSVLSEERANEVFNKLKNDEEIPFDYPLDGCYARAHKMALDMDDMGIISGKAFIEGDMYVDTKMTEAEWSYHVASLIMVKKNGKNIPTIIDPVLFDHPVSYDEWKGLLLKNPKSKKTSEYFTKRFNYDPDSRHSDLYNYSEDDLDNMNQTNRGNARLKDMMQVMQQGKK
jgi:hypothetical protein